MKNIEYKILYKGSEIQFESPYQTFSDIKSIESNLKDNLKKMKFDLMTPIQKHVISFISDGCDVMGCAQTGSGKTVAFLLPILNKMLKEGPPKEQKTNQTAYPTALILVPTRELAEQINKEARKLVHETGIMVVKVYGGVTHIGQIRYEYIF
jgi:ATP-dependent RNA helicase DDX3X